MTDPNQVPGVAKKPRTPQDERTTQRGFAAAYVLLGAAPSGLLVGWLIDLAAGTRPWFMLGCCALFLLVALVHLLRELR